MHVSRVGSCLERVWASRAARGTIIALLVIGSLLLMILLPLSFHVVEYDEMAFKRNKFGTVDTSKIYKQGRHFLPLAFEFVKFPSSYQRICYLESDGTQLTVFSNIGLEFSIDVCIYYVLLESELGAPGAAGRR